MSSLPQLFTLEQYSTAKERTKGWKDQDGNTSVPDGPLHPTFVIGVCGGTASGKTSVCNKIGSDFPQEKVLILSQDCFYKNLTTEQKQNAANYNFDHPDAFDWNLNLQVLRDLKAGRPVEVPQYDFVTHSRLPKSVHIAGATIIIFEGIMVFHSPDLLKYMDMKIFVDTDADTRLARRILRDVEHRGRDIKGVLQQYERFVKPAFDTYIFPTKKYADVIIPRGADNTVAINLIVQHIHSKLAEITAAEGASNAHRERRKGSPLRLNE